MNKTIAFLLILCGFFSTTGAFAQSTVQIKLLDADNALPIEGATYHYGNQNGISDKDGNITFSLTSGETMKISHLNYGTWEWDENALRKIIQQQVYYCKSKVVNLYPVTIIAVKANQEPDERIDIDYQDRMEHDGAAILNQIPGLNSIRKSGSYGFDPVFRGFKYDQLNIVLDGAQRATAACPNRMDPPTSQMAPNMMGRIEILKGPYALRFGSGFGGTINFIPTKLRFTNKRDLYGRFSSGYQNNGNLYQGEGQIGFSTNNYDLNLFGAWSRGDDYKAGNGQTVQADFKRGSFGANLGVRIAPGQQLRLSTFYNLARDVDFPALPMDLRKDNTWMVSARHSAEIRKGNLQSWNTTVYGSFVNHLMNNLLKPLDPRMMNSETFAKTYNFGGRTESIWIFPSGKLFAGADVRIEGATGNRIREFLMGPNVGNTVTDNVWQNGRISETGVFTEYHIVRDPFQYVFSARLEYNHANIANPSAEFAQIYPETQVSQVNPGLSAGIQRTIGKNFKVGMWLGRVQRSGSLTERYINYFPVGQDPYEMVGNPLLRPEINNQIDITTAWQYKSTTVDIDLFASYLKDFISSVIDTSLTPRLPSSPGVRQFINTGKAFKTGFEVNWQQDLPLGLHHQMGIAYTYAQDLDRNEPLPEIPPLDFRYTLLGSYLHDRLLPEVTFRHVMKQSRISTEFGETETPAFSLVGVTLAYEVTAKFRASAGVNNLFNKNYYEHLTRFVRGTTNPIYARGRNFFGRLSITF